MCSDHLSYTGVLVLPLVKVTAWLFDIIHRGGAIGGEMGQAGHLPLGAGPFCIGDRGPIMTIASHVGGPFSVLPRGVTNRPTLRCRVQRWKQN